MFVISYTHPHLHVRIDQRLRPYLWTGIHLNPLKSNRDLWVNVEQQIVRLSTFDPIVVVLLQINGIDGIRNGARSNSLSHASVIQFPMIEL